MTHRSTASCSYPVPIFSASSWPIVPAIVAGVVVAGLVSFLFQRLVLHRLRHARADRARHQHARRARHRPGVRGDPLRQHDTSECATSFRRNRYSLGSISLQEERLIVLGIVVVADGVRCGRGRSTPASGSRSPRPAENERAVATLGWSPERLSALTWTIGGALAGIRRHPRRTVHRAHARDLHARRHDRRSRAPPCSAASSRSRSRCSAGLLIGVGEAEMTNYQRNVQNFLHLKTLTGATQAVPFLVILARARRPRRSRYRCAATSATCCRGSAPASSTGPASSSVSASARGLSLLASGRQLGHRDVHLLGDRRLHRVDRRADRLRGPGVARAMGDRRHRRAHRRTAREGRRGDRDRDHRSASCSRSRSGLLFALPALRTRGVNLAVITLGLGFTISQVRVRQPELDRRTGSTAAPGSAGSSSSAST